MASCAAADCLPWRLREVVVSLENLPAVLLAVFGKCMKRDSERGVDVIVMAARVAAYPPAASAPSLEPPGGLLDGELVPDGPPEPYYDRQAR